MRAVVMVLRARFPQYWKSWLALGLLVAVTGGFVLTTAEPVLIAALAAGVLAAANLLAAVPALLAARSQPARLLRAE